MALDPKTEKPNGSSVLKPALILGSGFHRHVFGDRSRSDLRASLYEWHALIDFTADRMHVACPSREQPPVLRWETLIGRAVREGFRDTDGKSQLPGVLPAYRVEVEAKNHVAQVLREASADYPASTRALIPLHSCWGCVISLNFDHAWRHGRLPRVASDAADEQNASRRVLRCSRSHSDKRINCTERK